MGIIVWHNTKGTIEKVSTHLIPQLLGFALCVTIFFVYLLRKYMYDSHH